MEIYLLAINFIIVDKILGGIPTKIIEHIVINNVLSLTSWGATKILYGAGYLAMLPFTKKLSQTQKQNDTEYSLVDADFCNEYIIDPNIIITQNSDLIKQIPLTLNSKFIFDGRDFGVTPVAIELPFGAYNPVQTVPFESNNSMPIQTVQDVNSLTQLSKDWEIINKDETKLILINNKTTKQIIISKKEIDDMIVITKE